MGGGAGGQRWLGHGHLAPGGGRADLCTLFAYRWANCKGFVGPRLPAAARGPGVMAGQRISFFSGGARRFVALRPARGAGVFIHVRGLTSLAKQMPCWKAVDCARGATRAASIPGISGQGDGFRPRIKSGAGSPWNDGGAWQVPRAGLRRNLGGARGVHRRLGRFANRPYLGLGSPHMLLSCGMASRCHLAVPPTPCPNDLIL